MVEKRTLAALVGLGGAIAVAKWSVVGASLYEPIVPLLVLDSMPYLTQSLDHPQKMWDQARNIGSQLYHQKISKLYDSCQ